MGVEDDKRAAPRVPLTTQVRITHPVIGTAEVTTRDLSDSGIFLITGDIDMPPIGSVLQGQVIGPLDDPPVVHMQIVRTDEEGVGAMFVFPEDEE